MWLVCWAGLALLAWPLGGLAQQKRVDEQLAILDTALSDAVRLEASISLAFGYRIVNPDSGVAAGERALLLAQALADTAAMGKAHNALCLNHAKRGTLDKALEEGFQALQMRQALQDSLGVAGVYNNLAAIYRQQENHTRAIDFYRTGLTYLDSTDTRRLGGFYNNLAIAFKELALYDSSEAYYRKSLRLKSDASTDAELALTMANMVALYNDMYQLDSALTYGQNSLKILREANDYNGVGVTAGMLARTYRLLGKLPQAEQMGELALSVADSTRSLSQQMGAWEELHKIYAALGRYPEAYQAYRAYSSAKDSLLSISTLAKRSQLEAQHDWEVAQLLKQQEEEALAQKKAEAKARRNQSLYTIIAAFLLVGFVLVLVQRRAHFPPWLARGVAILVLLAALEFILVLTDPLMEPYVGDNPLWKLLANLGLALLLLPLHDQLLKWFQRRMGFDPKWQADAKTAQAEEAADGRLSTPERTPERTPKRTTGRSRTGTSDDVAHDPWR